MYLYYAIPYANQATYLGMTFDFKLNWKDHIEENEEQITVVEEQIYRYWKNGGRYEKFHNTSSLKKKGSGLTFFKCLYLFNKTTVTSFLNHPLQKWKIFVCYLFTRHLQNI